MIAAGHAVGEAASETTSPCDDLDPYDLKNGSNIIANAWRRLHARSPVTRRTRAVPFFLSLRC
ncbi:hypothetical protein AWH62_13305 [Maricaulis sp. W15]|nr:hypothetical protein AWH62_13305 [Maricaulis sp. W15]